jgi:hypothetical protein
VIRQVQKADMMGQQMEVITSYSNYQKTDSGLAVPYTTEMDYSGQFFMVTTITKVDVNVPVDPAIFVKP